MIFPDYEILRILAISAAAMLAGIWAFRRVKLKSGLVRIPVRCASVLLISCCSLMLAVTGCGAIFTDSSPLIYSPDRSHAVTVVDADPGAVGDSTAVELYSDHGLHADWIYAGRCYSVRPEDIHWVNNSDLAIYDRVYFAGDKPESCEGARGIRVHCMAMLAKTDRE